MQTVYYIFINAFSSYLNGLFSMIFSLRELVPPNEMVSSDGRQMHMGPHLGPPLPPHAGVMPGRPYPGAGEHGPTHIDSPSASLLRSVHEQPVSLPFSQQAMASFPQTPWKQLLGDRS